MDTFGLRRFSFDRENERASTSQQRQSVREDNKDANLEVGSYVRNSIQDKRSSLLRLVGNLFLSAERARDDTTTETRDSSSSSSSSSSRNSFDESDIPSLLHEDREDHSNGTTPDLLRSEATSLNFESFPPTPILGNKLLSDDYFTRPRSELKYLSQETDEEELEEEIVPQIETSDLVTRLAREIEELDEENVPHLDLVTRLARETDELQEDGIYSQDVLHLPKEPERALSPLPERALPKETYMADVKSMSDIESKASSESTLDEKAQLQKKRGIKATCRAWLQANYTVVDDEPNLVLPSAPTEVEKLCYKDLHRGVFATFGIFCLLSSTAGMWLLVICGSVFYWLGVFFLLGQVGFAMFQISSAFAKGFDHKAHVAMVDKHMIPLSKEEDCSNVSTVDIFLPCCKEPLEIVENTYKYVQALTYPASKLQVHVLDDGAMDEVKDLAARYGFNYIRRENLGHLKKAGNLRNAFANTSGEYFAIFDADFCPRHDFLLETIPVFKENPDLGILHTPQFFRTDKATGRQTWVERGAGATQELFYRLIQTCRSHFGAVICCGSCCLYRREALVKLGGTAPLESSEDIFTGFYLQQQGWRTSYLPIVLSCGICPDTARAYFSQQLRWCEGSCSLVLSKEFWVSNFNWKQKALYTSGLIYYLEQSLAPFIMPVPSILLVWARTDLLRYYNLAFVIPSLLLDIGLDASGQDQSMPNRFNLST